MEKIQIQIKKLKKITKKEIIQLRGLCKSMGGYDFITLKSDSPEENINEVLFYLERDYSETIFYFIANYLSLIQNELPIKNKEEDWYAYQINDYLFSVFKHSKQRGFWNVKL